MSIADERHIGDTISIRRPPRVLTDELGRNTWMGPVEPYEFQLDAKTDFNPYNSASSLAVPLPGRI